MRRLYNSINNIPEIGQRFEKGLVKQAQPVDRDKKMEISFNFEISKDKQDILQNRIDNGEIISPEELNTTFAPDPNEILQLISWLESNGFETIRQSNDKLSVYATSTTGNISDKLTCELVTVDDDVTQTSCMRSDPLLPLSLSNNIISVNGLQPLSVRKKNSQKTDTIRTIKRNQRYGKFSRAKPPYLISDILTAYNGMGMTYSGVNQTIGILIDTAPYDSDMTSFWQANSLPNNLGRITKINVRGVNLPSPTGEESLDTQWTSGIAKNSKIRIYCSGDLYFTSLDQALDRIYLDAINDNTLRQVSVSLGLGEKFMSQGELNTENTKYQRLRAIGVNCFISSGDSGSNEGGILQVSFPASSPNVVSVGGTKLTLNELSLISSETAWTESGGGISVKYTKPTWQNSLTGSGRLVPDISSTASPQFGAFVVLSGQVWQFGGTSWSAPIWAGICALINDARVQVGKSRIGFLPQYIYSIIGTNNFRDITTGNNGKWSCSIGYDRVTGIGTPNIKNLINYFISLP